MKMPITPFKIAVLACLIATLFRVVIIIEKLPSDFYSFSDKEKIFFFGGYAVFTLHHWLLTTLVINIVFIGFIKVLSKYLAKKSLQQFFIESISAYVVFIILSTFFFILASGVVLYI